MLPQLFVIGDSISFQYGPYLQKMVAGRFAYARKTGEEPQLAGFSAEHLPGPAREALKTINGCDSNAVLAYLQAMTAGDEFHPDVLLLNCGLHDIKTDPASGTKQVPLADYRRNLEQIARIATDAVGRLVWVRTTPVVDEVHNHKAQFHRHAVDVDAYNAVADEIMRGVEALVLDLFGFTLSLGGNEVFCDHVHYTEPVRAQQAAYIAGFLAGAGLG